MGKVAATLSRVVSHPWFRRVFLIAIFVVPAVHWFLTLYVRRFHLIDFDTHREMGRRFLAGEYLYGGNDLYPYLPSAAMYFSLLALVDRNTALTLRYVTALGCLYVTFVLLKKMAHSQLKNVTSGSFRVSALTLILAFPFILKDLDDAGPHLILLAILTGGIHAVWREREKLGAMWFGLAMALKVTAALFVPFFVWKRQWRLAGYSIVAAFCWILVPIVWMGPASWWSHEREWLNVAADSLIGQTIPYVQESEARLPNQALRQALKRYLITLPEDHRRRTTDPGYVPILNLGSALATTVTVAVSVFLVACFCWRTRRPFRGYDDPAWLLECSTVLVLALLLSPLTWMQHLVWLIPALYLIVLEGLGGRGLGNGAAAAMWAYVILVLALSYEILGKQKYALLFSYHPFTVAMLFVLAVLLVRRPTDITETSTNSASDTSLHRSPSA